MTGKMYGYARVSTDDQSLDIQREALRAAECTIIREEKVSGTSREGREQLQILIDFLDEGDTLCVTRLDRLARSLPDLIDIARQLEAKGAALHVLQQNIETATPAGRLFFQIMGAIAEFETNLRRERQLEGIAKAKANGRYKGGKLRFDPKVIRAQRAQGMGPARIARELGCSEGTVYRALKNGRKGCENDKSWPQHSPGRHQRGRPVCYRAVDTCR